MAVIDGVIWYNGSGMRPDALMRFDPEDESFQSWAMPSGVGIIRHTWVAEGGDHLIHQSGSNQVGIVRIDQDALHGKPADGSPNCERRLSSRLFLYPLNIPFHGSL